MKRAFAVAGSRALPLALFLSVLLQSGCAGLPAWPWRKAAPVAAPDGPAHAAQVAAMTQWRLQGKIGVQHNDTGFSGALDWRQDGGRFDVRISAPLNGGTFALTGDQHAVLMLTPKGEAFKAASARELMQRHLGWSIPLTGASAWVRGIPAQPAAASQSRYDEHGRWLDFAEDGWRVSVLDYAADTTPALPRKLFLNRDELKVRLVIRQWRPGPAGTP